MTVAGVDDNLHNSIDSQDREIEINHTASGGDYHSVTGKATAIGTIVDDDTVGLVFTPDAVIVTEAAGTTRTATYTVALATRPTVAVSVALASADETTATVNPARLDFTTANWKAGQTVTVTGVDDDMDNTSDRSTTIAHTASGGDYGSVTGNVAVTVTDDDQQGIIVSKRALTVLEDGAHGIYTYTLRLGDCPVRC